MPTDQGNEKVDNRGAFVSDATANLESLCLSAERLLGSRKQSLRARGLTLLRKAAHRNDPWAQYTLGLAYQQGDLVRRSFRFAARWYERAAEAGYDSAQLNLAICYGQGKGIEWDYVKALKWFRRAAKQGNRNAMFNLGLYYAEGRGTRKNREAARRWFEKAEALGDTDAAEKLRELR